MTTNTTAPARVTREARLRWVAIADMRVSPMAQRELNSARVDKIAANFDPEQVGVLTVSHRDGHHFIIDGQHRVEGMKAHGWGDQQIQCWVYEGLTEAEEAEMFLKLNDTLTVDGFAKYRVAITAGRPDECEIDRVVRTQGLVISTDKIPGAIGAVGTVQRVYARAGSNVLGRSLRIIRDAYGDPGFRAEVIDGIGMLCQRFNGELPEADAIKKLSAAAGGVNGLTGRAEQIRRQTGRQKNHCVAAAAVEIINRGKGGKKLPNWWAT